MNAVPVTVVASWLHASGNTQVRWWAFPVVALAAFTGECYWAVVGGGSVVTQFVLLAIGVPLPSAVAIDVASAVGTDLDILAGARAEAWRTRRLVLEIAPPLLAGGLLGDVRARAPPPGGPQAALLAATVVLVARRSWPGTGRRCPRTASS